MPSEESKSGDAHLYWTYTTVGSGFSGGRHIAGFFVGEGCARSERQSLRDI